MHVQVALYWLLHVILCCGNGPGGGPKSYFSMLPCPTFTHLLVQVCTHHGRGSALGRSLGDNSLLNGLTGRRSGACITLPRNRKRKIGVRILDGGGGGEGCSSAHCSERYRILVIYVEEKRRIRTPWTKTQRPSRASVYLWKFKQYHAFQNVDCQKLEWNWGLSYIDRPEKQKASAASCERTNAHTRSGNRLGTQVTYVRIWDTHFPRLSHPRCPASRL